LVTIIIVTKVLGKEGRGEVGLFVANMTLIIHFCSIIGGSAIAYLAPKRNKISLIIPSYLWSILITGLGGFALFYFNKISSEQFLPILFITILNSFNSINLMLLLGKEKVHRHNYLALLQPLILLFALGFTFFFHEKNITIYYQVLLFSFAFTFILSLFSVLQLRNDSKPKASLKEIFDFGFKAQGANIAQFLNYRLCYYFINSDAELGIYSNAIALAEGLWIFSRSLATVQYSKAINTESQKENATVSLSFVKLSFLGTLVGTLLLIAIPSEFYTLLFDKDFSGLPTLFLLMSPGIIAIALAGNFSAYFGGIGKFEHSLYSSLIGLFITIIGCYTLVRTHSIEGACITISISYSFLTLYLIIVFFKTNQLPFHKLKITKEDFQYFKATFLKK
jgi:O-antigen/teichoic acid export membrane protein